MFSTSGSRNVARKISPSPSATSALARDDVAGHADHEPGDHQHHERRRARAELGVRVVEEAARAGAPTARFLSFAAHGRLTPDHRRRRRGPALASAICPASRPRSSPTSPRSSASRSSSRARPASARPSSPRRSRRYLDRALVRLQCYEGLDEAKALYEWNYRKQLLRIQAEAEGAGWEEVQDDIFGEEFLLERPLMTRDRLRASRSSC